MSAAPNRLILFTRYPVPGKVKTRLVPVLGPEGAAGLHRRLVLRTLRAARDACQTLPGDLEMRFEGGSDEAMRHWLGESAHFLPQNEGDLGERMAQAFDESFHNGSKATVLIGSDCPNLTPDILRTAFALLASSPVVLGPANDGGYYLIGLTRQLPELFCGIPWGTDRVLANSLSILERLGLKSALLNPLSDVDRAEDLPDWHRITDSERAQLDSVSVIVPALNEERHIAATIKSVQQSPCREIIVVDGGSTDSTVHLSRKARACALTSKPGRARQMNAGAAQAEGGTLLFLHADTLLSPGWLRAVSRTLRQPDVAAGAFRLSIAGRFTGKLLVERMTNLRSRWLQLPYGDQGFFLTRALFEELGGFADLPIMEDYEFVTRVRRRGRVITLGEAAITSGRRWQALGVVRTTFRNQLMLAGYHLGLNPQKLAKFYRKPVKAV